MALNVTVQSYNGSLDFGLTACRKIMPDLPELARYMQAAHEELLKLTPAAVAEPAGHIASAEAVAGKKHRAPARTARTPARAKPATPKKAVARKPAAKTRTSPKTTARKTPVALQLVAGQPKPSRPARSRRAAA